MNDHVACRADRLPVQPRLVVILGTIVILAASLWSWSTPAAASSELSAGVRGSDLRCLALTIYFEARGEPPEGKIAVGHVVVNRVMDRRFPSDLCRVVRQGGEWPRFRCQFTWWCDGRSDQPRDNRAWRESLKLASGILAGRSLDPTHGALWYHADYVRPVWRKAFHRGPKIGRHIFYRHEAPSMAYAIGEGHKLLRRLVAAGGG